MIISEVKIKLLGSDILSIINEFIKIEGFNIKEVSINDGIILEGNFNKGINIKFLVKVELIDCDNNKIMARIVKIRIMNFGVLGIIRRFALKQLSKAFRKYGIESGKDKVIINVNKLLKDVPFIDLDIDEIYMKKSELWVEASNIKVSIAGELIKKFETKEDDEVQKDNIEELELINKIEDNYTKGRNVLVEKLPEGTQKYGDYIFILPDIISLIYRLLKDGRVPRKTKLIMSAAITYIAVPTDLIPKKIPFIGVVDDIGVAFFAINKILNDVPLGVIVENWQGTNELLLVLKKGIEYLINFTAAKNVEKLYEVVEELTTV